MHCGKYRGVRHAIFLGGELNFGGIFFAQTYLFCMGKGGWGGVIGGGVYSSSGCGWDRISRFPIKPYSMGQINL